ncbi:hypothetical protein H8J86_08340 [Clostridium perfringens]|nr:hypothetical protein [Clostridium perfringens]
MNSELTGSTPQACDDLLLINPSIPKATSKRLLPFFSDHSSTMFLNSVTGCLFFLGLP